MSFFRTYFVFLRNTKINFISTHNSRRSHLFQIWAQTMAFHFGVKDVFCYSGGTEATAMFPKIADTMTRQRFNIEKLSELSIKHPSEKV